ncbi:MAG: Fur family transcriptional regulator [Actinomycetes bacterium]
MTRIDTEWVEKATTELHASGRRAGGARAEVITQLSRETCAVTAEQLERTLADENRRVGRASIYRALEALAHVGLVQRVDLGETGSRWERIGANGHDHHHHLLCSACGQLVPFEDQRLETALQHLAANKEFTVDSHEVTLHGRCASCAAKQAA